jgi:hypothetical protein
MNKFTPLVKGIITGILMVLFTLLLYYTKQSADTPLQFLSYGIYAGGIIWTLVSYSRSVTFTGKFAELFGQGFRCFIMVTLIMVVFTAVFIMIHPEFAEEAASYYKEDLLKKGNKTPAEIEEMIREVKKHYTTSVVSITIFRYLIVGAIFSAAGSGILMKRK